MPVFNRPQMVLDALASITQQDIGSQQVEIIVVDDGSQPALALPEGIGHMKLIRLSANKGTAAARNAGIEASAGEYLAFLDADDVWLAGKLTAQIAQFARLATMEDKACLALATGFYCPNWINGRLEGRIPEEAASLSDFVTGCWFAPGSTLFLHRSAFDRVGLFDPQLRRLEDFDWFIRFGLKGGRVRVYPCLCAIVAPRARAVVTTCSRPQMFSRQSSARPANFRSQNQTGIACEPIFISKTPLRICGGPGAFSLR
ncbi:MAG: glycosyltransferase family 2 protein [Rhodospirillales bacterium]|nr:glycosyltransferase family 2 protein [Rhodospirillales bacterium]